MPSKSFNATFPYDDTLTGFWVEHMAEHIGAFAEFITPENRSTAVNDIRAHLIDTFSTITGFHRQFARPIRLTFMAEFRFVRIGISYHLLIDEKMALYTVDSQRGYRIEGKTYPLENQEYQQAFELLLKAHPDPPPLPRRSKPNIRL